MLQFGKSKVNEFVYGSVTDESMRYFGLPSSSYEQCSMDRIEYGKPCRR